MDRYTYWRECALNELKACFERLTYQDVQPLIDAIKRYPRIFLLAAGREGLALRAFTMRLMHLGKTAFWIWDDTTPAIGPGDLMICASGSADIGHENYITQQAKNQGADLLLISPSQKGFIYDLADIVVELPAAAYKAEGDFVPSKQMMGNLFEQALFIYCDLVIMLAAEEMDISAESMESRHRNVE